MNKVVCNICGTSYPENAAQCPICGFAHGSEKTGASGTGADGTYTHVKGGRFSKANVRKRNMATQKRAEKPAPLDKKPANNGGKEKTSVWMVVVVILLLLAIIAVVGYIALRFFLPNDFIFEGLGNLDLPVISQNDEPSTEPSIPEDSRVPEESDLTAPPVCENIIIDQPEIIFDAIGKTAQLTFRLEPEGTVDVPVFSSGNTAIAIVTDTGVITAVGEGTAIITVTCGSASAECSVVCMIPTTAPETTPLVLNRKEITFDTEGQSWLLYDGEIPMAEIIWSSDDNSVATIEGGKVVAVGNGDTIVYGIYNGETSSCIIHCKFDEDGSSNDGGISEAGGDAKRTYRLYNPYGNADDAMIKVGEEFTLKLVDENKKEITDAVWTVEDPSCCSYTNGIVKGLKSGTTNVTATYEGVTYTCIVRVK